MQSEEGAVEVVGMQRYSTNHSLGPRHQTSVTIDLSGDAFAPHAARVSELVKGVKVNGVITLHAYLQLHARGDEKAIARVKAKNPQHRPSEGGGSTKLTLALSDGSSFVIAQWAESFAPMTRLNEFLLQEGTRSVFDPNDLSSF